MRTRRVADRGRGGGGGIPSYQRGDVWRREIAVVADGGVLLSMSSSDANGGGHGRHGDAHQSRRGDGQSGRTHDGAQGGGNGDGSRAKRSGESLGARSVAQGRHGSGR